MSLDLSVPIRDAIIADAVITAALVAYNGSFPVFTRVPVPDDAPYPMVVVSSQLQAGEEDGVADERPTYTRDIMVYGRNGRDATNDQYHAVEAIAFELRTLFNRKRDAIQIAGWTVTDIQTRGPAPAPVDDEQTVGRMVLLTLRLASA